MGFFDSLKKTMGLAAGEFEIRVQPETLHVGGLIQGTLRFRALKALNVVRFTLELDHGFPVDDYHTDEDEIDLVVLDEMVSFQAGEHREWPFFFELPPQVAATMGRFSWTLEANAVLQGGSTLEKEQPLQVRHSPVMGSVLGAVQSQFGFQFVQAGADDDGIWMEFNPVGPVRSHFNHLEIAYDEQDDALTLWISLDPFRRHVIQRYEDSYDPNENSVELVLEKSRYAAGGRADDESVLKVLQPLFSLN